MRRRRHSTIEPVASIAHVDGDGITVAPNVATDALSVNLSMPALVTMFGAPRRLHCSVCPVPVSNSIDVSISHDASTLLPGPLKRSKGSGPARENPGQVNGGRHKHGQRLPIFQSTGPREEQEPDDIERRFDIVEQNIIDLGDGSGG